MNLLRVQLTKTLKMRGLEPEPGAPNGTRGSDPNTLDPPTNNITNLRISNFDRGIEVHVKGKGKATVTLEAAAGKT